MHARLNLERPRPLGVGGLLLATLFISSQHRSHDGHRSDKESHARSCHAEPRFWTSSWQHTRLVRLSLQMKQRQFWQPRFLAPIDRQVFALVSARGSIFRNESPGVGRNAKGSDSWLVGCLLLRGKCRFLVVPGEGEYFQIAILGRGWAGIGAPRVENVAAAAVLDEHPLVPECRFVVLLVESTFNQFV